MSKDKKSEVAELGRSLHGIIAAGIIERARRGELEKMVREFVMEGSEFEAAMLRIDRLAGRLDESTRALMDEAFQRDSSTIYTAQEIVERLEREASGGDAK